MTEISKENRIEAELKRISRYFESVAENQRAVVSPLLQNAAFMAITLEDLQEQINSEGVVDTYMNGKNQYGVKQSATLQSYNSLIKNYAAVIKTLSGLLPPEPKVPLSIKWEPREKTPEEWEAERRRDEEHQRQILAEIDRAAELQRKQREPSSF